MPRERPPGETARVITNVIVHLHNDLPIVVDMEGLPKGSDRSIRCTNVRTVDGKRPTFVNDRHSTFVFPMSMIRLLEVPADGTHQGNTAIVTPEPQGPPPPPPPPLEDDEPDDDLLARIRSV
ncbi:MAG TPA: hypothetical protein VMZ33_03910 [Candidatus Limnocylindrales bacterium]|nr:hypothetical protein [Candidatus Limnocylindrales bacterium]